MKSRRSPGRRRDSASEQNERNPYKRRRAFVALVSTVVGGSLIAAGVWIKSNRPGYVYSARPSGTLTFNKDIAPVVLRNCAICHRPGQSAPFSLLTHEDVRKRAKQIAEVTQRRYMPPWLPESGHGEFAETRRLTVDQIGMIQQWVAEGAVEGSPADLPSPPQWAEGWQLGEPDLVLTMPQPYTLAAEGRDVYRNFVIPVPAMERRYVRAVEFRPGNPKVVHHAFVKVDPTRQSRRLEAKDGEPGFPGMNRSDTARMPDGHFLSWQPGKMPAAAPAGLAWKLEGQTDLVLEMHLRPTGRPEVIQASVGLYFTEETPTNTSFKLQLVSHTIDIPPGATNHIVQDRYVVPVDLEVLAVLPHAHYLCKRMEGWATLPDGTRKWLLLIKEWDFNWQGDYRYARPVFLPKGTTLTMNFSYDNSADNARNPNQPPKRVGYGPESTDEMAELWFQVVPIEREDLSRLAADYGTKMERVFLDYYEYLVRRDANDARARAGLGLAYLNQRRYADANEQLQTAVRLDPNREDGHYYLGLLLRMRKQLAEARREFETVLRINPDHYKAHGNLGLILMDQGNIERARKHFESALRINPDDDLARENLDRLLKAGATLPRQN